MITETGKSALMLSISSEVVAIKRAKINIKNMVEELNKFNPFKIGDELVSNGWSHIGKVFIVDAIYIASYDGDMPYNQPANPNFFAAEGRVKNKNGELSSVYRARRFIKFSDSE